jgi:hypothetical protein
VLSLGVDGIQVRSFGVALFDEGLVLCLSLLKFGLSIDFHNCNMLVSVDQHLLSVGSGSVHVGNRVRLHLVNDDALLTLGSGDPD